MNPSKTEAIHTTTDLHKVVEQWAAGIIACGLLVVLFATLFPFNFSFTDGFSVKKIASSFHHPSNVRDWLANILLFLPFSFGLSGLMQTRRLGWLATLVTVLFASFSLSFAVEVLQVFLPSRSPTRFDILANSVGGFIGFLGFQLLRLTSSVELRKYLSPKKLTGIFIGYTTIAILISSTLQNAANLSNWDSTFPLLLGNEQTGDRPWQGYVSQVWMTDRAILDREAGQIFTEKYLPAGIEDSLLAFYQLTGKGSYSDRTGHLPDLSWRGKLPENQSQVDTLLAPSHWLGTATPVTYMTQKIRQTSQFTLSAIVATADTTQTGPARIISVSGDSYRRNFTLGQKGADLVFRLRTKITGENGATPELIIPDIFTDTNFHYLIISYDSSVLRFYIDRLENLYSITLNSGLTLFQFLSPFKDNWAIHLKTFNLEIDKILYYVVIFLPLGCILALIATVVRGKFIFHILLICSGVVVPALMLEGIFVSGKHASMSLENLLLSMAISLGTMLIVKLWIDSWLNHNMINGQ